MLKIRKKNSILKGNIHIRLLALLLALLLIIPMVACKKDVPPAENGTAGNNTEEAEEVLDPSFQPILRFAVASDIHLRRDAGRDFESRDRLAKLFDTAYGFCEKQPYSKLDGMFFCGDYTQDGYPDAQGYFFDYVKANTKDETYSRAVLGNHEYYYHGYGDMEAGIQNFLDCSGYETADEHKVIGGYHFIFLNMDRYDVSNECKYSTTRLNWLSEELNIASAADPTGEKPIFVFHHAPAKDAVYGAGHWASDAQIGDVLAKHPQVVDFSGHSHRPANDPRSILQGEFTALNTGSLAYLSADVVGHPQYHEESVVPVSNRGEWATGDVENPIRTGNLYYIIEVNAENQVRIILYNILADAIDGEPIVLQSVKDRKQFERTEAKLSAASDTPRFAENAKAAVKAVSDVKALIEIPQATGKDLVQNYRCEIFKGDRKINTIYRLSCSYMGIQQPTSVYLPIANLEPSTDYTVKIYPVNSWNKVGEPLTVAFKTSKGTGDITADVISIAFQSDGTAVNTVTGQLLSITGNPVVERDPKLNRNVGIFDGGSAYSCYEIENWYDFLNTGFTAETYVYFDSPPRSSYVDAVSNQESGGFGFEYRSNGNMCFYCCVNGRYYSPGAPLPLHQFVHLVATFDGSAVRLYMQGELVATTQIEGKMTYPAYDTQFLVIGGDSSSGNECAAFMVGKVALANVYSSALSEGQVAEIYAKHK